MEISFKISPTYWRSDIKINRHREWAGQKKFAWAKDQIVIFKQALKIYARTVF